MATIGLTTSAGAGAISIEDTIWGTVDTIPVDGYVTSITARVSKDSTSTHNLKCALYSVSGNFLGETEAKTKSTATIEAITFNFSTPVQLHEDDEVIICIWADAQSGNCYVRYDSVGGLSSNFDVETYGTWPNPMSIAGNANTMEIYATYTAGTYGSNAGQSLPPYVY